MGARMIVERLEEYGVRVERVINCGGIPARNPMVMQIYADVLNRPIGDRAKSADLRVGSAIAASVVAGKSTAGTPSSTCHRGDERRAGSHSLQSRSASRCDL